LVDIDILIELTNQILMERPSYTFIADLEYENVGLMKITRIEKSHIA